MKQRITVSFEEDPAAEGIEVRIRAKERGEDVDALIASISGLSQELITVIDPDGAFVSIPPFDIVSVSVDGKVLRIVTEEGRYTIRQTLQSLESRLEPQGFVRISRYELVNLDKVIKFDFTLGGTLRLELAGGMETWASRRNIPAIRKKLMERG